MDRRKVMVSPTTAAETALADAPPLFQEHFTKAFARAPEWQQTQILSSLQRIVSLMEAEDVSGADSHHRAVGRHAGDDREFLKR